MMSDNNTSPVDVVKLTEQSAPRLTNEDDRPALDAAESSWDPVVHSTLPLIHDTTMSSTTVAQPQPLPPVFPEQAAAAIGAFAVGGMNNNHDSWNDHSIDDEDNDNENDDNEMALVPPSSHTAEVQVEAYIVVEEEEEDPETGPSRTAELEQQIMTMSRELATLRAQNAILE